MMMFLDDMNMYGFLQTQETGDSMETDAGDVHGGSHEQEPQPKNGADATTTAPIDQKKQAENVKPKTKTITIDLPIEEHVPGITNEKTLIQMEVNVKNNTEQFLRAGCVFRSGSFRKSSIRITSIIF